MRAMRAMRAMREVYEGYEGLSWEAEFRHCIQKPTQSNTKQRTRWAAIGGRQ
jgi:hypothetical protein